MALQVHMDFEKKKFEIFLCPHMTHVIIGVDEAFETLLFAVFGKELIDEFRRRRPAGTYMFNIIFGL